MITGVYDAPDGHRIEWDIPCLECDRVLWCKRNPGHCTTPGSIRTYNEQGVAQRHASGRIHRRDLVLTLGKFKREHNGQMEMVW